MFCCCCCFLIQYNEYNTIIEHVSTPVPTMDNRRIQTYTYRLCIYHKQKATDIQTAMQTESWTKYFTDRYLPCTVNDCMSHVYTHTSVFVCMRMCWILPTMSTTRAINIAPLGPALTQQVRHNVRHESFIPLHHRHRHLFFDCMLFNNLNEYIQVNRSIQQMDAHEIKH